ncbi:MAG: response regulator [Bdellovibrionales bacterium]|nr:response regulator [Bdellovibrionales bacterium]
MRTLVVEDENTSARILTQYMSELGEVVVARNGEEAFNTFCDAFTQGQKFDLVIMDIMMPEVDGQEALTAIREYEESHGLVQSDTVPIIMASALDDLGNIHYSQVAGCTEYLTKPLDKTKLFRVLHRLGLAPSDEA